MDQNPAHDLATHPKASPWRLVAFIALSVVALVWMFGDPDPPAPTEHAAAPQTAEDKAWRLQLASYHLDCKRFVRERAMHPSAAEFDREIQDIMLQQSIPIGSATVVLTGNVKLLNSFGAKLPHRYACKLDVPKNTFTAISIDPA